MEQNRFSFKKEIEEIADRYIVILAKGNDANEEEKLFVEQVSLSINSLKGTYKVIIINDFFIRKYVYWWKEIYKKNSYLSYKNKAMKLFLEVFYGN